MYVLLLGGSRYRPRTYLARVTHNGYKVMRLGQELLQAGDRRLTRQCPFRVLAHYGGQCICIQLINFQYCHVHLCAGQAHTLWGQVPQAMNMLTVLIFSGLGYNGCQM